MAKAILELEMPESCAECPCKGTDVWGMVRCRLIHMKSDKYSGMAEGYAYKRRPDCPLKLVDVVALERKKPKKVVLMETTNKFKNPYGYHPAYGHCPVCGRIYWDKCHVGNYCDNCGQRLEVEQSIAILETIVARDKQSGTNAKKD